MDGVCWKRRISIFLILSMLLTITQPVYCQSFELLGANGGTSVAGALAPESTPSAEPSAEPDDTHQVSFKNAGGPTPEQVAEIIRILTAAGFTRELILQTLGADISGIPAFLAENWATVGPALQQARVLAGGFATSRALAVGGPTVLAALLAAGLITVAIFQARLRSAELSGLNEMREWQMNDAMAFDLYRRRSRGQNWIRVPSYTRSADIIIVGPSAGEISEQNFQNYLQAAGRARGNPSAQNLERVAAAMRMLQRAADTPRETNDW
jgi:hypothetical protein